MTVALGLLAGASLHAQEGNLRVGSLMFDVRGRAGATYSSNIASSGVEAVADTYLSTGISARGRWELTKTNELSFDLGAEYRKYIDHPELDSARNFLTLSPETELRFTVYTGAFRFHIADGLWFSSDPTDAWRVDESGTQVQILEFSRFNNTLLAGVDWQATPLYFLQLGVSRTDLLPLDATFDYTRRTEHAVFASGERVINSKLSAGLWARASQNRYEESYHNDSTGRSFGVQANWEASEFISVRGRAGWSVLDFDRSGLSGDRSDYSAVVYSVDVSHLVNRNYSQRIQAERAVNYGFVANNTVTDTLSYAFSYRGLRWTEVNGSLSWQHGSDSGGPFPESYTREDCRLVFIRPLSKKLRAELAYGYSHKDSDLARRSYERHDVSLYFSYDF